jgi:hypothetical protein
VETHDRVLEDLSAIQDRLRVADSAMKLRRHKEENSDAWEALSAEVLKEASIARGCFLGSSTASLRTWRTTQTSSGAP